MFASMFYSHPKEAASVRQSLAEPYILVGIAKAYMSMYCFPSSQGSSSGAVEGLPIQPGQKKSFGHYQSFFQSGSSCVCIQAGHPAEHNALPSELFVNASQVKNVQSGTTGNFRVPHPLILLTFLRTSHSKFIRLLLVHSKFSQNHFSTSF